MSFANIHLYVRLNGSFGSSAGVPVDKWSAGFRVGIPGTDIQLASPALQTFANAVHTAAATLTGTAGSFVGNTCYFQYVTVARIGTDGKYNPAGQLTTTSVGAPAAGAGSATLPWNTAHSFGLRTAAPRGYASNGRFYMPLLAAPLTAGTGRLNSTQVVNRITAARTFFNAVNVAANVYDPGAVVCVMSNVGTGKTERVISLRADERLDSIERRENDAAVTYQTIAL